MPTKHSEFVQACVQDQRTAALLLTKYCHEETAVERVRLLSLAMWHAGRADAYATLAQAELDGLNDNARKRR